MAWLQVLLKLSTAEVKRTVEYYRKHLPQFHSAKRNKVWFKLDSEETKQRLMSEIEKGVEARNSTSSRKFYVERRKTSDKTPE